MGSLWLEAYLGEGDEPKAFIDLSPASLSTADLERVRTRFVAACESHMPPPRGPQA